MILGQLHSKHMHPSNPLFILQQSGFLSLGPREAQRGPGALPVSAHMVFGLAPRVQVWVLGCSEKPWLFLTQHC